MKTTMQEEKLAVESGYWLLYRHNPLLKKEDKNPFTLDSKEPIKDVEEFMDHEKRFTTLKTTFPDKVAGYREATSLPHQRYAANDPGACREAGQLRWQPSNGELRFNEPLHRWPIRLDRKQ